MEIAPNSTIVLYHGIPLTPTYENTYWFDTLTAQIQFFHTVAPNPYVKRIFNNQYYTRVNRGQIKVKVCADDVYDCNYLSFQNTSYGSKWFYAFITSIEWINNEVTLITFQIDVMQTYLFDYTMNECFVEREHSISDNIGDNIENEPFNPGEYVANPSSYDNFDAITQLQNYCYVVGVLDESFTSSPTDPIFWNNVNGKVIEKVYTGLSLHAFPATGITNLNSFLDRYKSVPDNVLMIYTVPRIALNCSDTELASADGYVIGSHPLDTALLNNWSSYQITGSHSLDGYVPLNKKLYTYPYNYYMMKDSSMKSLIIRYEFCNNLTPTFKYASTALYPPSAYVYPSNYKNLSDCETEVLIENGYPLCSWVSDYWQMAMAQEILPETSRSLTRSIIDFAVPSHMESPVSYSFAGMGSVNKSLPTSIANQFDRTFERDLPSFMNNFANNLNDLYWSSSKAQMHAEIFSGSPSSPTMGIASGLKGFHGCRMSVSHHVAEKIDQFFSMYGYAVNRVKVPNIHARSRYSYIKTNGCSINGNMPADDVRIIQGIFDNGVRFWVDKINFGSYPKINNTNSYNNILSGA